jgi:hypothetical protein
MRSAGRRQTGILQGSEGGHRGQRHLAHRLPDAHAQEQPGIGSGIRPNCEAYGYILDSNGKCAYVDAYNREVAAHPDAKKVKVWDKTCLCTHMRNFDIWTCGHYTYKLKDTTVHDADGTTACSAPNTSSRITSSARKAAMAEKSVRPLWLNLEYLSAEDWVTGFHTLPSPHPRLPLTKYFFMPGYVAGTGGLLRERELVSERTRFQADPTAQTEFLRTLGLAPEMDQALHISLFSYESPAIESLFSSWVESTQPICCLLPAGKSLGYAARFFGMEKLVTGDTPRRGQLRVKVIPMLDQDSFDRLHENRSRTPRRQCRDGRQ